MTRTARNGIDRCPCGCKYWTANRCVDCNAPVTESESNR